MGPTSEPRDWAKRLAPYRQAMPGRAVAEVAITTLPFLALWYATWLSLDYSYWLSLLLAVPTAGFLVRLFCIQHDCGHGSFFHGRRANDRLGRMISVLTLTPYEHWRHQHALHHASSGNLDRRGQGDVDTMTVREFRAMPAWRRLFYRIYRSPLAVLGLGPLFIFVLKYRLPEHPLRATAQVWRDVMATNLAIGGLLGGMALLVGWWELLLVQLPITWLASGFGVWLFYVQHQFEHTYWERNPDWTVHNGGFYGSSHFDLPPALRWLTANIGIHHVHHLASRIPSYRLGQVLRDHPELTGINRLTLRHSFQCFRLALWDENQRRLVSFREARSVAA